MSKLGACVALFVFLQLSWAERVSYEGYKVYHVTPKTKEEADILYKLHGDSKYDFWLEPRVLNVPAVLMVTPDEQSNFEQQMKSLNINTTVLIDNVEKTNPKPRVSEIRAGNVSFTQYMTHSEINAYLSYLPLAYPNLVTLEQLGTSYEGRELLAVRISQGGIGSNRPAIFVDAGIHAREWIAPSTALYLVNQLVENNANYDLHKNIDWIILPVVNPDGYDYSLTTDSLWRKTRSIPVTGSCLGVDGNRNFDYYWMEIGASSSPCDDTFAGLQPFSESETTAVGNYLNTHRETIKLYLTLHSYGRYLLYPWGFTEDLPSNDAELYTLGYAVASKISDFSGTNYTIGSSSNALYPAAGGSDDYAMGACGVQLSYTIELPEGGTWGFHPPVERILPIVIETFEGFKEYQVYIEKKYVT